MQWICEQREPSWPQRQVSRQGAGPWALLQILGPSGLCGRLSGVWLLRTFSRDRSALPFFFKTQVLSPQGRASGLGHGSVQAPCSPACLTVAFPSPHLCRHWPQPPSYWLFLKQSPVTAWTRGKNGSKIQLLQNTGTTQKTRKILALFLFTEKEVQLTEECYIFQNLIFSVTKLLKPNAIKRKMSFLSKEHR